MHLHLAHNRQGFYLPNALYLATAAEAAYHDTERLEPIVHGQLGLPRFHFFDEVDTQGFIATDDDLILVCFRGTESNSIRDWLTDANVGLTAGPLQGEVHAGFYDALSAVWQMIDRRVSEFDPEKKKRLWVTGHSLGAALATLAVARWLEQGRPVQGLYTYGQPRTGNTIFARNFNFAFRSQAFRFVNQQDLVTRVPPRSFGYSHLGTFRYLNEAGELLTSMAWWNEFLTRWTFGISSFSSWLQDGVGDHSMRLYKSCLQRLHGEGAVSGEDCVRNLDSFLNTGQGRRRNRKRRAG